MGLSIKGTRVVGFPSGKIRSLPHTLDKINIRCFKYEKWNLKNVNLEDTREYMHHVKLVKTMGSPLTYQLKDELLWIANIKRYRRDENMSQASRRSLQNTAYKGKMCLVYIYKSERKRPTEKWTMDRNHQFTEKKPQMVNKPHSYSGKCKLKQPWDIFI